MTVARRVAGGVVVLNLSGRMTGLDAPGELKQQVKAALSAGHRRIVLNLSQLSYVDSALIGELVACCLAAARLGGTLKMACAARRVQEVFMITRLGPILDWFESENAAVDSFLKADN